MAKPNQKTLANRQLAIVAFTAAFPVAEWPSVYEDFIGWNMKVFVWTRHATEVPQRHRDYIQSVLVELERPDVPGNDLICTQPLR